MAGICLMSYEMNQFFFLKRRKNTSAKYHPLCPEDRSGLRHSLAVDCCLNAVCLHACTDTLLVVSKGGTVLRVSSAHNYPEFFFFFSKAIYLNCNHIYFKKRGNRRTVSFF